MSVLNKSLKTISDKAMENCQLASRVMALRLLKVVSKVLSTGE